MISAILVAAAASALAPPVTADIAKCELHLFALDLGTGPQPKGNMLIKVLPTSNDPLALINIMSPQDRMNEVSNDQYRAALRLGSDTSVIRHWDVAVDRTVRKSASPLVDTPSRCHLELIGYSSSGFAADRSNNGKNQIFINLMLRQFSTAGILGFKYDNGGRGQADAERKVGREVALQSLTAASVTIISDFGDQAVKKLGWAK